MSGLVDGSIIHLALRRLIDINRDYCDNHGLNNYQIHGKSVCLLTMIKQVRPYLIYLG